MNGNVALYRAAAGRERTPWKGQFWIPQAACAGFGSVVRHNVEGIATSSRQFRFFRDAIFTVLEPCSLSEKD